MFPSVSRQIKDTSYCKSGYFRVFFISRFFHCLFIGEFWNSRPSDHITRVIKRNNISAVLEFATTQIRE